MMAEITITFVIYLIVCSDHLCAEQKGSEKAESFVLKGLSM